MLESLYIKNYRNLKELKINSLAGVNLITGRNNTGKSSLLEAIAIYANKLDISSIYQLLENRGEKIIQPNKDVVETNINLFSSMFSERKMTFDNENAISIVASGNDLLRIQFAKYREKTEKDNNGNTVNTKQVVQENDDDFQAKELKIGLTVSYGKEKLVLLLDHHPVQLGYTPIPSKNNIQFVRSWNINTTLNGTLFDCITLTDKEKYVVEALRIIEPDTDKIAFIADNTGERKTVVKLSSIAEVLPLQSMGDGINRILTIILALVNADNGFLLIDEFENGLHYTVQEQLWKMIFNLAQRLNTQVFVTTHSNDCIKSFENILNSSDNSYNGKLIRLDNKNGIIKQIEFNAEELQIANNQNIEIR
jgi:AAA15 family ATPase/GTPase